MRKRFVPGLLFASFALLFLSQSVSAQSASAIPGPGWQVMSATYGAGARTRDVTYHVRNLLAGAGKVQVTNQNLGGDPAPGANKVLRIQARNFQGLERQFSYNEGSWIDASQFYNYNGGGGGYNGSAWMVMWADYGAGNRRVEVTDRVRRLLSGSGFVRVTNQNMGGDPYPGADKVLRISARNYRGHVREFSYREGSSIDSSQFYNYGGGRPPVPPIPPRPPLPGPPGSLQIVRAYYGLNNRTSDVSQSLRRMIRNNSLVVQVTNYNMGGDPYPGADKVLTVVYRINGREQTSTVKEGNTLRIP
ncbi:MAG TPA: hypothetical protein VMJ93_10510 [Verrucomicrobiae bacterium]|nr:hypothetical protein [Verrucomicrobiae bacterium]